MAFILAAIVVFIPLILTPGLFLYYDVTPKIIVLLVGTAAAAFVALFRRPSASGLADHSVWRPGAIADSLHAALQRSGFVLCRY